MGKHETQIEKTKEIVKKAVLKLLEYKSFDEISISDISRKTMLYRSTIYNHFETKEAILEEIKTDICGYYEDKIAETHGIFDKLILSLDMLSKNRGFFVQYFNHYAHKDTLCLPLLQNRIEIDCDYLKEYISCEEDRIFIINGIGAIIRNWLNNGCNKTSYELAGIIIRLIKMFQSFEKK